MQPCEIWAALSGFMIGVVITLVALLLMGSSGIDPDKWS